MLFVVGAIVISFCLLTPAISPNTPGGILAPPPHPVVELPFKKEFQNALVDKRCYYYVGPKFLDHSAKNTKVSIRVSTLVRLEKKRGLLNLLDDKGNFYPSFVAYPINQPDQEIFARCPELVIKTIDSVLNLWRHYGVVTWDQFFGSTEFYFDTEKKEVSIFFDGTKKVVISSEAIIKEYRSKLKLQKGQDLSQVGLRFVDPLTEGDKFIVTITGKKPEEMDLNDVCKNIRRCWDSLLSAISIDSVIENLKGKAPSPPSSRRSSIHELSNPFLLKDE